MRKLSESETALLHKATADTVYKTIAEGMTEPMLRRALNVLGYIQIVKPKIADDAHRYFK